MKRSKFLQYIKEEMSRMNESGFDNYDMQPQAPMTKQQQIDASWDEFNQKNQQDLARQRQNGEIESYLDSNLNTDNHNGQLGMDAMSQDPDIAAQGQMTVGTPRQTMNNFDNYEKQKYGTYGESKKHKVELGESDFRQLVKECLIEVLNTRVKK